MSKDMSSNFSIYLFHSIYFFLALAHSPSPTYCLPPVSHLM